MHDKITKLLWELFGTKCPYIKDWIVFQCEKLEAWMPDEQAFVDSFGDFLRDEPEAILDILMEILPAEIHVNKKVYRFLLSREITGIDNDDEEFRAIFYLNLDDYLQCSNFGKLYWKHESLFIPFGSDNAISKNILQSILSLLEAIQKHKDKDNFKFVWGTK